MCRPGNGPSRAPPTGGHIGPPLREAGSVPEPTGIGAETDLANGAGRSPPPTGGGAGRRVQDGGVMSPRPTGATLVVRSEGPMWSSAPTGRRGKPYQPPGPAAHSGAFATRSQGMGRNRSRNHPQRGHQPRAIPQSRPLAVTAPFAQGSLGDGGCGLPRRPCGPPRNDNGFLSFRGAERRGNPSFLRWTGDGPPRSSAPTENLINHPSQPARSEASAPAAARDGRESAQRPSQKGDRPATARAALSEAESAERAAGQIRFLPDDLRVQHGAEGSEV